MLHYQGLAETADHLACGDLRAVVLTEALLDRIARLDPQLRAFVTVTADRALDMARRADEALANGMRLGPMHGVPIAVKDLFDIAGVANTAGMPIRSRASATQTATVIRRLEAAGAVLLGTLRLSEGVFGEYLPPGSTPRNPWDAGLWPGASSGGSAVAVAAGLCFGSIASDTGGSIRMPSSVTGLTGLKPGWGRVSRHGVFELAASLDHVGPIARSARDAALLMDVISGDDPQDPTSLALPATRALRDLGLPLRGLRFGFDPAWLEQVDPEVAACHAGLCADLAAEGAERVELRLPDWRGLAAAWYRICAAQAALAHRDSFARHRDDYGQALAGLIEQGARLSALDLQAALQRRLDFTSRLVRAPAGGEGRGFAGLPFPAPPPSAVAAPGAGPSPAPPRLPPPPPRARVPPPPPPPRFRAPRPPARSPLIGLPQTEEVLLRLAHRYQCGTSHHEIHPAAWP